MTISCHRRHRNESKRPETPKIKYGTQHISHEGENWGKSGKFQGEREIAIRYIVVYLNPPIYFTTVA